MRHAAWPPTLLRILVPALVACSRAGSASAQSFDPPFDVSQSASGSYVPSLSMDLAGPSAGTLRLFWHDFTGATNLAWCSDNGSGAFAAGAPCPMNVTRTWTPRAAADRLGRTHLVWRDLTAGLSDIEYAVFDGTAWSAPLNLSASAGDSRNPVIAIDSMDRPHVLWEENPGAGVRFYETHFDGAAWSAPADTGLPFAQAAFLDVLRIAFDSTDTLHATWHDGATSQTEIFHAERPDGGSWSLPENLSSSRAELSAEPAVAVGPTDIVVVAWVEQDALVPTVTELCVAMRAPGAGWGAPQILTHLGSMIARPSVATGPDGAPRFAFGAGPIGGADILYLAGAGAEPVNVSASPEDSQRCALLVDASGTAVIAWQEGAVGTTEIDMSFESRVMAPPILLMAAKDELAGDVLLAWTGGAAPYIVASSTVASVNVAAWPELTPPGGIAAATWRDAGVLHDGRLIFYDVR